MKKAPKDLTEVIHAKADAELTAIIEAELEPLWQRFSQIPSDSKPISVEVHINGVGKVSAYFGAFWTAYKEAAFLSMQQHFRDKSVQEFVEKVERLTTQTEELRGMVEGDA